MADSSNPMSLENHLVNYVNGLPVPPLVTQHQLDFMKTMELFPDDVWICTYPRSGTTWTQQIVRSIRSQANQDLRIDEAIPYLEAANNNFTPYNIDLDTIERPRAFKTHMPYHLMPCGLPKDTPCKYIYVVRNPKDMAVSYYYHYFSFKSAANLTFDKFLPALTSGQVYYGDYFDHVRGWWEHKDDDNVLFLKYEDMKKDTRATVAKIVAFIEVELTEEAICSVLEKSSFSSMKNDPTTNYEWFPKEIMHPEKTPFIRKGIVGGWKGHFTAEKSAQFDDLYRNNFEAVGLELAFD